MNLYQLIERALRHRDQVNGLHLAAPDLEDLAQQVHDDLLRSADVAVVDPAPRDDDEAVIVYAGAIAIDAYPISPLAGNGAPTVDVWTSLYEPGQRAHLVVFDLEDEPWLHRRLVRLLERAGRRRLRRALIRAARR